MHHRPPADEGRSVAVIGAGIVGCATALALTRDGHRVTVFDSKEAGEGASYGNAGGIVTGAVTPSATPAVIRALPSYVLDRNSAAVLRLRHAVKAAPWLLRFIRAGMPTQVDRIAAAMAPLVSQALISHRALAAFASVPGHLTQEGWLKIYSTEADFAASALERRLMVRHDVEHLILDRAAILEQEPALNPAFCYRGVYQPKAGNVRFPRALARAYLDAALSRGASLQREAAVEIRNEPGHGVTLRTDTTEMTFDRIVVAAGAWSARFARQLGDRVCLDTERGYHIRFPLGSERLLRGPVVLPGAGFVLSPMHDGLRLVSGDELAGLDAPPGYSRIRALVPEAARFLPALATVEPVAEWMGHRPSTPDSMPVIGRAAGNRSVVYAFGHGHLGVTLAAVTAQLVADLLAERQPSIDLLPFSASRF